MLLNQGDDAPLWDSLEGVVVDFSAAWMRVALHPKDAREVRGGGWRLDLWGSNVAYKRCKRALQCFGAVALGCDDGSEAAEAGWGWGGPGRPGEALWRALAGRPAAGTTLEQVAATPPLWPRGSGAASSSSDAAAQAASSSSSSSIGSVSSFDTTSTFDASSTSDSRVGSGGGDDGGADSGEAASFKKPALNDSQARAIKAALSRTLTLWQGPPGTGKTRTLLRLCAAALPLLPIRGKLLAVAASNVAVDNVAFGLLELGVRVVRVGQPVRVAPALRGVTLVALAGATPQGRRAAELHAQADAARPRQAFKLRREAVQLEELAEKIVLSRAQVVCATCISAGHPRLESFAFPLVVVDEATQATEPATMVAVAGRAQALLLVGDQEQLPPTVKSRRAEQLGLGMSLFVRLQEMGLEPMLLDTQYRM